MKKRMRSMILAQVIDRPSDGRGAAAMRSAPSMHARSPRGQRGVALVVALILLVVITLIGLAAVSGTIMQSKMAANQYDRQTAFQNAASGLRIAKYQVMQQIAPAAASSTAGPNAPLPAKWRDCSPQGDLCLANPFADTNLPTTDITPVSAGSTAGEYTAPPLATGQPQYVVEYMGRCWSDPNNPVVQNTANSTNIPNGSSPSYAAYFRITSRSGDPASVGDRAIVTLQEVVVAPGAQPDDGHGSCRP